MCLHNLILIIQCSLYYSNKVICHKEAGTATRWRRFNIIPLRREGVILCASQLAVASPLLIIPEKREKRAQKPETFNLIRNCPVLKEGIIAPGGPISPLEGRLATSSPEWGFIFLRDLQMVCFVSDPAIEEKEKQLRAALTRKIRTTVNVV